MKYILIAIILIFSTLNFVHAKEKCEGTFAKLKPECNILGKSMNKMKEFSKENKTLNQTLGINNDKSNKKSMKDIANENKTIDQTYKNIKEKLKKK